MSNVEEKNYSNMKSVRTDIPEGAQQCGAGVLGEAKQMSPKESFLHRLDYAEETLVRQLTQLKEIRNVIRWADPESLRILEKVLQSEHLWRY